MSRRHGFRSSSARRRRTVSRDTPSCSVSRTIARPADPASSACVPRASEHAYKVRGVGAGGGNEQRRLLARQLAGPLRTGLLAERQLQVALHEAPFGSVDRDPLTERLLAIISSMTPASAASRICARLILRAACLPPLSNAVSCARSVSLRSTRYRMFIADPPLLRPR